MKDTVMEIEVESFSHVSAVEEESAVLLDKAKESQAEMNEYCKALSELGEDAMDEVSCRLESLKKANSNIRQAYGMTLSMAEELGGRWKDIRKSRRKRKLIPAAPSNTAVDLREEKTSHFAKGINAYKLLLILFVGSFVGVVIEMLWCLLKYGYIESRAGLVYGPFNLLYGVGGVALTLALYRFRNHRRLFSFFGGMLIGSIVEYVCSFVQEVIFGSRSWDYSAMPFNINGRICLLYSVFWGMLGVLWIKNLYPRLASLILKIPSNAGKIATVVLTVFLAVNAVVTCAAVYRWSERLSGEAASGAVEEILDARFDDGRMERIFANMDFGSAGE